jgi:hypothetical protein
MRVPTYLLRVESTIAILFELIEHFAGRLLHLGKIEGAVTPQPIKDWSLTTLKEKLIKIGAKIVSHGRYIVFQMAEVAIPRNLFAGILRLIAELRPPPVASTT